MAGTFVVVFLVYIWLLVQGLSLGSPELTRPKNSVEGGPLTSRMFGCSHVRAFVDALQFMFGSIAYSPSGRFLVFGRSSISRMGNSTV